MRHVLCMLIASLVMFVGSCREIPLIEGGPIEGYQIEGYVFDRLQNPLRNVLVVLEYQFIFVNEGPPPSRSYSVTDPNQVVVVAVYDSQDRHVRTLFQGTRPVGPMLVEWDKKTAQGLDVPSGLYTVKYQENGVTKKSYTEIVSGTVTARTDSAGRYVIPPANLPIGYEPVYLSGTGGNYAGNYRIGDWVVLEFLVSGVSRQAYFALVRNHVTRYDIIF
jgi:hypothetical protein